MAGFATRGTASHCDSSLLQLSCSYSTPDRRCRSAGCEPHRYCPTKAELATSHNAPLQVLRQSHLHTPARGGASRFESHRHSGPHLVETRFTHRRMGRAEQQEDGGSVGPRSREVLWGPWGLSGVCSSAQPSPSRGPLTRAYCLPSAPPPGPGPHSPAPAAEWLEIGTPGLRPWGLWSRHRHPLRTGTVGVRWGSQGYTDVGAHTGPQG